MTSLQNWNRQRICLKDPPDSIKPVSRDDRRKLDARTNEAVRKYQYYKARKEFPITDEWIAFHFWLKTRLSESQRQTIMQAISMKQQEKKVLLQTRLSFERTSLEASGRPSKGKGKGGLHPQATPDDDDDQDSHQAYPSGGQPDFSDAVSTGIAEVPMTVYSSVDKIDNIHKTQTIHALQTQMSISCKCLYLNFRKCSFRKLTCQIFDQRVPPVSYTHLTLPTKRIV